MKCRIEWIGQDGRPTPDNNDAIGLAICFSAAAKVTAEINGAMPAFPICEEHAAQLKELHISWPGTEHEVVTEWRLIKFKDLKLTTVR